MLIFKTSGNTLENVIQNQKHAFRNAPKEWNHGEIVLVSKNKSDCVPLEKQIQYIMRIDNVREAKDEEIITYWPGNSGRWHFIIDCYGTERVPEPFNLDEILGDDSIRYQSIVTFGKLFRMHEEKILPFLMIHSTNNTDEISDEALYPEGSVTTININAYERDGNTRKLCIEHYGCVCSICGFNYEEKYGELGKGYIQVHHIIPLSDISHESYVNPIRDLIPLCANCHSMIHRRKPTLTPEELKEIIEK